MAKQPLLFNHVLPSQNFPLCSRLFKFHFEKKLLVFITIPPSLSINFWKQHSPGSALNPAVLNGVTLGWHWQRWDFSVTALGLSFGVRLLCVPAGQVSVRGCRWAGGVQALLPWDGVVRHHPNLCLCLVGRGVTKLRGFSAWLLGLTEVWCDGLLWLFSVLIAEVDLFPSFLCGGPSHQESKSWTEGICWIVVWIGADINLIKKSLYFSHSPQSVFSIKVSDFL